MVRTTVKVGRRALFDIDKWYTEVEAMAAKTDPKDFELLEAALREADAEAKEWMRRRMGLS